MKVTYYYPWGFFHPIRSGAAAVAAQHLEYFRSRGYQTRVLLLGADLAADRAAFERHYHWLDDVSVFCLQSYPSIKRLFDVWNFRNYLLGHSELCNVPEFRAALSAPADLVFLNYVFSTPLLDAMPPGSRRILESVDIMSNQFLSRAKDPVSFEYHLRMELEMYGLYDAVIMINEAEARLAHARSADNALYVPRAVEVAPLDARREHDSPPYDLLFVGSTHAPNVDGARWFYQHVFEPHLKPHGLTWAIVGSVCGELRMNDSSVTLLGQVDDLDGVYRQSKVVVVPLFEGAGISIKTLEGMGRGKPIVSTPCGTRGLTDCDDCLVRLPFDEAPHEVAQRILELCRTESLRKQLGRRAAEYVQDRFSPAAYGRRMDELIQPTLSRTRRKTAAA